MAAERYPYSGTTGSVPMTKYVGRYLAVYFILGAILMLIFALLKQESPSVIGFLVIFCSAQFAGLCFYRDKRRLPERSEKRRFGLYAMLASLVLAVVPFIVLMVLREAETMALLEALPPVILLVALIISFGIGYWLCAFGFGQGAKLQEKAEIRKAKRDGA